MHIQENSFTTVLFAIKGRQLSSNKINKWNKIKSLIFLMTGHLINEQMNIQS